MDEGLRAAQELIPSVELFAPAPLAGGERSHVWRARFRGELPDAEADGVGGGAAEGTVIVKAFRSAGESWARETSALRVLPRSLGAPRVVAAGAAPPVVVLTDLGDGPSLAQRLLGDDPDSAVIAIRAWARGLAAVHNATRDLRPQFRDALERQAGDLPLHDTRIGADVDDAVRLLDAACGRLGVAMPSGAMDEVRELAHRLGGAVGAALTPADACPDDTVPIGDELVLVDYENAQWRHVAWDVAYLRVPWPTCWCAWRLPDELADIAVSDYRAAADDGADDGYVGTDAFDHDVEAAAVGWSLMSASMLLDAALGDEAPATGRLAYGPSRRAMISHRLTLAARSAELPAAALLAERLLARLRADWGDVPLALAPAFRAGR